MRSGLINLIGGVLVFLSMIFFGLFPILWRGFKQSPRLSSISNCFSGGLFLAIGLIHILPEASDLLERKNIAHLHDAHEHSGHAHGNHIFPTSYLICLGCFSTILIIEKLLTNSPSVESDESHHHKHSSTDEVTNSIPKHPDHKSNCVVFQPHNGNDGSAEYCREIAETITRKSRLVNNSKLEEVKNPGKDSLCIKIQGLPLSKIHDNCSKHKHSGHSHHDHTKDNHDDHSEHDHAKNHHKEDNHQGHHHHHIDFSKKSSFITYLLLMVLGIHSMFEGLACGIAKSHKEVFGMLMAMLAHKWSEALSMGISFVEGGVSRTKAILLTFFLASLSPLGMLVGWALSSLNDTVAGVCMALSAGTFLYISCTEIINEEFSNSNNKFLKVGAYIAGIVLVTLITCV